MSNEEKRKTRAEKVTELNTRVWAFIGRGIKEGRILWGKVILNIISTIALILIILYWSPIVSFLAAKLRSLLILLNDPTSAAVVANWLLAILILTTIGVVFIPFLSAGSTDPSSDLIASPTTLIP